MSNLDKVLIIWNDPVKPPDDLKWPTIHVPVQVMNRYPTIHLLDKLQWLCKFFFWKFVTKQMFMQVFVEVHLVARFKLYANVECFIIFY